MILRIILSVQKNLLHMKMFGESSRKVLKRVKDHNGRDFSDFKKLCSS